MRRQTVPLKVQGFEVTLLKIESDSGRGCRVARLNPLERVEIQSRCRPGFHRKALPEIPMSQAPDILLQMEFVFPGQSAAQPATPLIARRLFLRERWNEDPSQVSPHVQFRFKRVEQTSAVRIRTPAHAMRDRRAEVTRGGASGRGTAADQPQVGSSLSSRESSAWTRGNADPAIFTLNIAPKSGGGEAFGGERSFTGALRPPVGLREEYRGRRNDGKPLTPSPVPATKKAPEFADRGTRALAILRTLPSYHPLYRTGYDAALALPRLFGPGQMAATATGRAWRRP